MNPAERLLTHAGKPVSLSPKAFETLLVLVENAGHALDKSHLLEELWPDTFVEEATLAKQISLLRKALGEGETGSRYIETIPKFGYRFVAEVRRSDHASQFAGAPTAPTAAPGKRSGLMPAVVLVAVLLFAGSAYLAWREMRGGTTLSRRVVLAVLPFENLSGDDSQEYFADGLTEEMIARLGGFNPQGLAVIARTSAAKYKGTSKGAAEIGRELRADYLVESSVRREGDRVRVTAQLIRTSDQSYMWAETYEREVGQILPLQQELAETIARQLQVTLAQQVPSPKIGSGTDVEAHLLYLRGRYHWNRRTPEALQQAVAHYQQALDRNPGFANAWAGLATAYALFDEYNILPARESYPRAKAAAMRALELDPSQGEARATLALIRHWYDWDWEGAEQDFQQATASNPNHAVARHWYGMFLMSMGRFAEAREQFHRALSVDPLSSSLPVALGASYYHERNFDQAIAEYQRALKLQPLSAGLRFHLGRAYVQKGMFQEAIEEFKAGRELSGEGVSTSLAFGYAAAGQSAEALRTLREAPWSGQHSPYYLAAIHAALGDEDRALRELERGFEQRLGRLTFLNVEPMFDPIRDHPRFRDLCRRLGLPEISPATAAHGPR